MKLEPWAVPACRSPNLKAVQDSLGRGGEVLDGQVVELREGEAAQPNPEGVLGEGEDPPDAQLAADLHHEPVAGVASVGTRPTVNGTHMLLEVHLFEFSREVYGHYININFLHKLRDEQRFASLDELKAYIQRDIDAAPAFGLSDAQVDRLRLTPDRIQATAQADFEK